MTAISTRFKRRLFNKMRPDVGRQNALTREHWVRKVLQAIPAKSRMLDAGAGTQRYKRYCKHLNYVSQDFAQYDGKGDGAGLQTDEFNYGELDIVSDITDIPEPSESFDAIMCTEVLEHIPDPVLALKEFTRLLKPGGSLLLTAPFCSLTHYSPYHFSTGFSRYWYQSHLTALGFEIVEIQPNGNFFEFLAQEIYRIPTVTRRYTGARVRLLEYLIILLVQRMLLRLSKEDKDSSELLCFGYHILARKTQCQNT